MTTCKIATWNVNSLRVRLPHLLTWLQDVRPDVLAIQETKVTDDAFPFAAIREAGYHVICSGQKTYNGVALLSREIAQDVVTDFPNFADQQRRIIGATFGSLRILNLYVPNGESMLSAKYQYKLDWLQSLTHFLQYELKAHPNVIVLGDFNIAPTEIDVHDPQQWEGKVLFSLPERQAFQQILTAGFRDCFREVTPDQKEFTWWDYRLYAFKRNLGLRIDHILATPMLTCTSCYIDKDPRAWERPSDHAPVIADFVITQ